MASLVLRPTVVSFLDVITRAGRMTIDLEEIEVKKRSVLDGSTLAETRIPERTGLIVMAVKRDGEDTVINPGPNFKLRYDDSLVVMGKGEQVGKLEELAR